VICVTADGTVMRNDRPSHRKTHGSGGGEPAKLLAGLTADQLVTWSTSGPRAHDRLLSRSLQLPALPHATQVDAGFRSPSTRPCPLGQARSGTDVPRRVCETLNLDNATSVNPRDPSRPQSDDRLFANAAALSALSLTLGLESKRIWQDRTVSDRVLVSFGVTRVSLTSMLMTRAELPIDLTPRRPRQCHNRSSEFALVWPAVWRSKMKDG
jgi:hypothetical protein